MSSEHWPQHEVSLNLLAGACEVGKDLFLLGSFGGFGGVFHLAFLDKEAAIEEAKRLNKIHSFHLSVFRLKVSLEDDLVEVVPAPKEQAHE